ncbi:MAG: hypothetical protein KME64_27900 [Scytonematopsis contorta HA4267-MV1]|jgi:hypothetical protein|nr:hypothetical protein [Scytonematopsis contorta HA4267-MV1]
MKQEESVLKKCLKHLQSLPEVEATVKESQDLLEGSQNVDGLLTICSPKNSADYAYTIQLDVTSNTAKLVISYFKLLQEKLKHKLLLITRYLCDSAIEQLINENIEFIDSFGNIYINNPPIYILIRAKNRPKAKSLSSWQITPTTLKVIYILLKKPDILTFSFENLADAAETTLETIKYTLENLYKLGYLMRQPKGRYRIANYMKLFERWEIGYVETLRPKLLIGTFTPALGRTFSQMKESIIQLAKEDNLLIGGELGAELAMPYLIAKSSTLHVNDSYSRIAAKLKLKPSPQGEIIFLQQFGKQNYGSYNRLEPIADPLLIHAELLLDNDDRVRETAERFFNKFIQYTQQNDSV